MLAKRIIPCLDINKGRVVKGVNFVNLVDAGDPVEVAKTYNAMRADEIVFLDITASHEGRATMYDVIAKAAEQVFIPLTVGGGISSTEHFRNLLNLGADKISVNSAAVRNPDLITEAALKFGRQCVVVAIDAKRNDKGSFDVYLNGGRINTGKDAIDWAIEAENAAREKYFLQVWIATALKRAMISNLREGSQKLSGYPSLPAAERVTCSILRMSLPTERQTRRLRLLCSISEK